jgi:hypothetical protein
MHFSNLAKPVLTVGALLLCQCEEPRAVATLGAKPAPEETSGDSETKLPETVSFNEHIQPILSENCYECHGPDAETRYPENEPYRLDLAESALAPREDGQRVIIPGDPEASLLVKLIHSDDPDVVMPPPDSHRSLDPGQIALLEKWIDQGAEYQAHWAFLPVERPEAPESEWGSSPIDGFIDARLAANGLEPNGPEAPARLVRRLYFDLTGLPPSPEEVAAFERAAAEDLDSAVAETADRLLDTSESAEHFARYWLDAARYADTHGIHIDNYRAIWPYREWVVRAFRENMPWDQFTIEQIAGDLLPDPTLDQLVATGFHRCLPTTGEGGAIAEEYLAIYAQDRTDTTAAVWLGLTMGCASCHDHKFDPISTEENYSFNAFFRNNTMAAMDRNRADHPPNVFVPLMEDRERFKTLNSEIEATENALAERRESARSDFEAWLPAARIAPVREIDSTLSFRLPLDRGDEKEIRGEARGEGQTWKANLPIVEGPLGPARQISGQVVELGDHASFERSDAVSFGGFVRIEGKPSGSVISRMDPEQALRGWDLWLSEGQIGSHVIDRWPDAANKLVAPERLENGKWHHVMVVFDGSKSGHQAQSIYIDGKRVRAGAEPNSVGGDIVARVPLVLGARAGGENPLEGGKVALHDFRFYRRALPAEEIRDLAENSALRTILDTPADQRSEPQAKRLYEHFLKAVDEPTRELTRRLDKLQSELAAIRERGSVSLVMEEKPDSEPTAHVLERGDYSNKGKRLPAATPAILPPMPEDAPNNRLGLARWLVSDDNPLTPRVTMNRLWNQIFGTGIVETVGDFGIMGARPTHPQLLDWLAAEFVDSGWDYRHMVKTLVTSASYRQSAIVSPEELEADPDNRLLSRGPRFRLDGEQIRDLALDASDLLAGKIGGPPVKPYQPEGVWSAVAMPQSNTRNYKQDSGASLYRRSLYTFWKRTAPHPSMEIFNAPSREITCVARERTNTPLQAFVTLNDPQFVEASRRLAENALRAHPGETPPEGADSAVEISAPRSRFENRLDFIATRLLARPLDEDEKPHVRHTLESALESFRADPGAAEAFVSVGETDPDPGLDVTEVAAWTLVANQILNLDETLNK